MSQTSSLLSLRALAFVGLGAAASHADWQQTTLSTTSGIYGLGVVNTAVFAGTGIPNGDGSGVMHSASGCEGWMAANTGISNTKATAQAFLTHGDKLFLGTKNNGIYVSADGGSTWTFAGATSKNITGFAKGGGKIFASTKGDGVWVSSDDGATWTVAGNLGIAANKQMLAIGFSGSTVFAASNGYGAFKSTDAGETWTAVEGEAPATISVFTRNVLVDGGTIYITYDNQGIRKSTDGGATWTLHTKGFTSGTFNSLVKAPTGLLIGSGTGLFHSVDNGVTWTEANTGLGSNKVINVVAVFGDKVLAGSSASGLWIRPASELTASTSLTPRNNRSVKASLNGAPVRGLEGFNAIGRAVLPGSSHAPVLILTR
jgi:hypothetical protein